MKLQDATSFHSDRVGLENTQTTAAAVAMTIYSGAPRFLDWLNALLANRRVFEENRSHP